MAFEIAQIATGASSYFKTGDMDGKYEAILVEVVAVNPDVPTEFGPKLEIVSNLTCFKDAKDKAPDAFDNVKIQQQYLAEPLQTLTGKAAIVKLGRGKAKPGRQAPWIWDSVDPTVQGAVIKFAEARDAAMEDELADAPEEF